MRRSGDESDVCSHNEEAAVAQKTRVKTRARPITRKMAEQRAHLLREIVETLLFVGLVFIIVHFAIQTYRVADTSMTPQLQPDQLVVINKAAYVFSGPQRGDIVLVDDPTDPSKQYLERVIGIPGDTITVTVSTVQVNGVTLNEPYVHLASGSVESPTIVPPTKLGPNQFWVMNDSRSNVTDSRTFGPAPRSNIAGKAVLIFWPLSQLSGISTFPGVFAGVSK